MKQVVKTEAEWRAELDPRQYRILREKGTEAPFTGEYDHVFEPGTYHCAGCGAELFESDAKYDSGCGWPAFFAPASEEAVEEETDTSYGMVRTEVCARAAAAISATSSPTARGRRACATASTRPRSSSRSRRPHSPSRRSWSRRRRDRRDRRSCSARLA